MLSHAYLEIYRHMHLFLAGTKGSRPIYIELCSVHLRSRLGPAIRRRRARPAAPFSRPASRRIPSPPLHPIPPSVAEASRAPTAVELDLYCALDRLPYVVEPRAPGLVYRRRAPPARPRRRTRPPARPAVVDYNVGFFIVFLDNTNKQYLVVI